MGGAEFSTMSPRVGRVNEAILLGIEISSNLNPARTRKARIYENEVKTRLDYGRIRCREPPHLQISVRESTQT